MNILFIFGTGSEVRQFLHSGIISNLVNKGNSVFISSKKTVIDEIEKANAEVCELPWYNVSYPSGILSRLSKILDLSFEKKFTYRAWRYNDKDTKPNPAFSILASFTSLSPIFVLLLIIERKLQKTSYVISRDWVDLLRKYDIDRIVVNVPRNYPAILFAAQILEIPVILSYHTNKDIYAQGRITFRFQKYGVWNDEMANDLLFFNPFIKEKTVEIIGCSHFSYLADNEFISDCNNFMAKFNINLKKDFLVLYTAAGPGVIPNEKRYIDDICESLDNIGIHGYKIIVRTNPMDFTSGWDDVQNEHINVVRPQWYYDPEVSFNYTKREDLKEFSSLLKNCQVCINVPSTVTTECAIAQIPVINICYNNILNEGTDILKFWKAPFYKNAVKFGAVIPAFSKRELQDQLKLIKDGIKITGEQRLYLIHEIGIEISSLTRVGSNFILD